MADLFWMVESVHLLLTLVLALAVIVDRPRCACRCPKTTGIQP